ncbi:hypothetical protein BDN72DRAFT_782606 [Pluteus cervinus]|uniref:Uncharacterized protein n=1 Tax=Pluteus cervinus TaxID=181527 RepID=A0ACD2ZXK0_9AGAR|nr:hypothetical protein BDN72DRAFT_782606 [Pluteus cervinus]
MNIIEHVWDYLDRRLRHRERPPKTRDELWEALQEEWHKIPLKYIRKLYLSIPRRIQALVRANGRYTKY